MSLSIEAADAMKDEEQGFTFEVSAVQAYATLTMVQRHT